VPLWTSAVVWTIRFLEPFHRTTRLSGILTFGRADDANG
jgi:hypothetical protein